ncbi:MAG TPA: GNAT family N-acetyltransferase [Bacteroidia bacterium]|nr:GNAT family N-acetyltransferase [Bacteroidia bacterium]
MEIKIIHPKTGEDSEFTNDKIVDFLFEHLDQYGDPKEQIMAAIKYIFNITKGGFITLGIENNKIIGAIIINETGMNGYIPENILVYIAVDKTYRGKGIGKQLMIAAMENAKGNIALHVEPDNPALHLYKKLGFTNKYLEMRLIKK